MPVRIAIAFALAFAALSGRSYDLHIRSLTPIVEQSAPRHAPLRLVEDGRLAFSIVRDRRRADWGAAFGAAQGILVEAFQKATGSKPEVLDPQDEGRVGRRSFRILLETDEDLPPQGFRIETFVQGVRIAGNGAGVTYGAADFAERVLGARWYYPGEDGCDIPACRDLSVAPMVYEDAPWFDARGANTYYFFGGGMPFERMKAYMGGLEGGSTARLLERWRFGKSLPGIGGHSPGPVAMARAHPNRMKTMFYTDHAGKLWYANGSMGSYWNVFDLGFADMLVEEYRRAYASSGKDNPYGVVANERGVSFGVCDCLLPKAMVLEDPWVRETGIVTAKDYEGFGYGMANVYGRFLQYLGNRVKEEFPGKRLYALAYINSRMPPNDPKWHLPDNVEINLCEGRLPRRVCVKKEMDWCVRLYREWYKALGSRPVARAWLYSTGGNPFVRAICGEYVGEMTRKLQPYLGREGLFYDFDGGKDIWHYFYSVYVNFRSQWNPNLDVGAALDEMWLRLYGTDCGAHMKRFHDILKDAYERHYAPSDEPYPAYPMKTVDALERELRAALDAAAGNERLTRRVKLVADQWPDGFKAMRAKYAADMPTYNVPRVEGEVVWKEIPNVPLRETVGLEGGDKAVLRLAWSSEAIRGRLVTSVKPLLADGLAAVRKDAGWVTDFALPASAFGRKSFGLYENVRAQEVWDRIHISGSKMGAMLTPGYRMNLAPWGWFRLSGAEELPPDRVTGRKLRIEKLENRAGCARWDLLFKNYAGTERGGQWLQISVDTGLPSGFCRLTPFLSLEVNGIASEKVMSSAVENGKVALDFDGVRYDVSAATREGSERFFVTLARHDRNAVPARSVKVSVTCLPSRLVTVDGKVQYAGEACRGREIADWGGDGWMLRDSIYDGSGTDKGRGPSALFVETPQAVRKVCKRADGRSWTVSLEFVLDPSAEAFTFSVWNPTEEKGISNSELLKMGRSRL